MRDGIWEKSWRSGNSVPLYIWLDTAFLILLLVLLLAKKKYAAVLVGLAAGVLYMLVDYGIFHLVCGARSISEGYSLFWVLLWMSMSYGFTNFVWIWLWISKDRRLFEWSLLILLWWFCCPLLAATFGGDTAPIVIQRTTGAYHGYMAAILFIGYLGAILWNLRHENANSASRWAGCSPSACWSSWAGRRRCCSAGSAARASAP